MRATRPAALLGVRTTFHCSLFFFPFPSSHPCMRIDPNMPTPPQRIPSPPDSNASGERSVGRTWIFDALWSLCTNRSVKLQVPDTILLRNGAPYRWISTNDNGFLSRKSLQIYANHEVDQIPSARGKSSIIDARLILNAIAAFPISSTGNKDDDEPVCCAWYHDHRSDQLGNPGMEIHELRNPGRNIHRSVSVAGGGYGGHSNHPPNERMRPPFQGRHPEAH